MRNVGSFKYLGAGTAGQDNDKPVLILSTSDNIADSIKVYLSKKKDSNGEVITNDKGNIVYDESIIHQLKGKEGQVINGSFQQMSSDIAVDFKLLDLDLDKKHK